MSQSILVLFTVFLPLCGAVLTALGGRISQRVRNILAAVSMLAPLLFALILMKGVLIEKNISVNLPATFLNSNCLFAADILAVFMAIVSSLISTVVLFYSFEYIKHYDNQNEYYSMIVLFLASMLGIVFSANLIILYIFWELTAICSWRLIGFFRQKTDVIAADKSFLVTFFGAIVMLIGFVIIYQQCGSFDLPVCKRYYGQAPLENYLVLLILAGIFSKSATLPFQTWLPDAGVAPSPVTALLHAALLVKIGVYVFARLFIATFDIAPMWQTIVPIAAAVSALVAAAGALIETDIKRIIAYSTISQIGFIFFGLATGNLVGITGGLVYILMHGLSKAGLFLCAGIIEQRTHIKDITKLGGLIKTMPLTAGAFLFCAFSVMGIPPFGGFFCKYFVFAGGIQNGQIAITLVFVAGALITIVYLTRLFSMIFLGELKINASEKPGLMVISVVLFAVLSLVASLFMNYISYIARQAVLLSKVM